MKLAEGGAEAQPPSFFRHIVLRAEAGRVYGGVQDNVHQFEVVLTHDGQRVTKVTAEAIRFPWTTCPMAEHRLEELAGLPLDSPVSQQVDQAQQCTHMLDLARLAIAQAIRGGERRYTITVEPSKKIGTSLANLLRDGVPFLRWHVVGTRVVSDGCFEGHVLTGRAVWHGDVARNPDLREAGLVLRRAMLVYRGRSLASVDIDGAIALPYRGACMSFQPDLIDSAVRPEGFVDIGRS